MEIVLNDIKYQVIKNEKDGFDSEKVTEKYTDYFTEFDYILGDWAYGKLRLKGFNKPNNPHVNKFNNYQNIDKYIIENCAFGCRYFIMQKD